MTFKMALEIVLNESYEQTADRIVELYDTIKTLGDYADKLAGDIEEIHKLLIK